MKSSGLLLLGVLCCLLTKAAAAGQLAGTAHVTNGDTVDWREDRQVFGVDAPELGQKCEGPRELLHCGKLAAIFLGDRIEGQQIECVVSTIDEFGRTVASCRHQGEDLSGWLVREGYALAFVRYSDRYVADEAAARERQAGLWAATVEPPWEYRARRWAASGEEAPDSCRIKGNISRESGDRIYHAPWSPHYNRTRISVEHGERWFCTEAEALAAGWRPPKR